LSSPAGFTSRGYEPPRPFSGGATWHGFPPEAETFRSLITVNIEMGHAIVRFAQNLPNRSTRWNWTLSGGHAPDAQLPLAIEDPRLNLLRLPASSPTTRRQLALRLRSAKV
jgi:hypothetical protein